MTSIRIPTKLLKRGDQGSDVELLHGYLTKFGYFPSEALKRYAHWRPVVPLAPTDTRVFDERTEKALTSFQRANGLAEEGILNAETLALMQMPRCGFPDSARRADFVAQGNRWPKSNVTYSYSNFTSDIARGEAKAAIRDSFEKWAAVTTLTVTEVSSAGDIRLAWYAGDHGDGPSSFGAPGGVLAHAFFPPPYGGDLAGDVHFDDADTWSIDTPPSGIDLGSVSLHELGHALGLAHSSVSSAVMYAYYHGPRRELTADDIQRIQSIYGAKYAPWTLPWLSLLLDPDPTHAVDSRTSRM